METSLTVLVIILSLFLAVFLILSIVLLVKAIQIADRMKHISGKVESVVERVDRVAEVAERASGSLAIGKLVSKAFEHLQSRRDSTKSKEDKKDE